MLIRSRILVWVAVLGVGSLAWRVAPRSESVAPQTIASAGAAAARLVRLPAESVELTEFTSEPARLLPFVPKLTVAGVVEAAPDRQVRLNARVAGRLRRVLAGAGDRVAAGQTLAVIESEELHKAQVTFRLAQRKATVAKESLDNRRRLAQLGAFAQPKLEDARTRSLEQAAELASATAEEAASRAGVTEAVASVTERQAFLELALARRRLAERNAGRARMLHRHGVVSLQDSEQAQAAAAAASGEVATARAALEHARARVQSAQVRLTSARDRQRTSTARSSVASSTLSREESVAHDGLHTYKEVAEADLAHQLAQIEEQSARDDIELLGGKPGDDHEIAITSPIAGEVTARSASLWETVGTDRTLFTVLDLSTVWVQLHVYQSDLAAVQRGHEFRVRCDALPDRAFTGRVAHVGLETDEATHAVKVRCEVAGGGLLRPGMMVTGEISGIPGPKWITVPAEAVQTFGDEQLVFTPLDRSTFRPVAVRTGLRQDNRVAILTGLAADTPVVVKNAFLLRGVLAKEDER